MNLIYVRPCLYINQKHKDHQISQNSIPWDFNIKLQKMEDQDGYSISFYIFYQLFVWLSLKFGTELMKSYVDISKCVYFALC